MFWSYNKLFLLVEEGHFNLAQPGLTEIIPPSKSRVRQTRQRQPVEESEGLRYQVMIADKRLTLHSTLPDPLQPQ